MHSNYPERLNEIKIYPSILSADFSCILPQLKEVKTAGCDTIHIDIMDGHFVDNITIGPDILYSLKKKIDLSFDVHLMIENPEKFIKKFIDAGASNITVHIEASKHIDKLISIINNYKVSASIALNPATPLTFVDWIIEKLDMILIMTVNPGFAGQSFIYEMLPKISMLKEIIVEKGASGKIQVDGGINENTAPLVTKAGATILVAGSSIFSPKMSITDSIKKLQHSILSVNDE